MFVFSSGCTTSWQSYPGQQALGLVQQGTTNSYNQATCQAACTSTTNCQSIDYNNVLNLCYFGYQQNPTLTSNPNVIHLNLISNCG